jgi:hypothetical protein
MGMSVRNAGLLRQEFVPRILDVVQDKADELHLALLAGIAGGIRNGTAGLRWRAGLRWSIGTCKDRKEVYVKDEAQYQEEKYSANAQMGQSEAAEAEPAATAAASLIAAILYILTLSAGCPLHGQMRCKLIAVCLADGSTGGSFLRQGWLRGPRFHPNSEAEYG